MALNKRRIAPLATPTALPYPILRRLSNASQSRAALRSAWRQSLRRAAAARWEYRQYKATFHASLFHRPRTHPVGSKNSCGLALVVCGAHQKGGARTRSLRITDSRVRHCPSPTQWWEKHSAIRPASVALERFAEDTNGELVIPSPHPGQTARGITLSPVEFLEKLAALVPLPQVHLVRYGGCLAPHSSLRGAIPPTPRQQGVEGDDTTTESPCWSWARLLKQVFALDMATCPLCCSGVAADYRCHHRGLGPAKFSAI